MIYFLLVILIIITVLIITIVILGFIIKGQASTINVLRSNLESSLKALKNTNNKIDSANKLVNNIQEGLKNEKTINNNKFIPNTSWLRKSKK